MSCVKPWPSWPRTRSAGIRQSVKKTSFDLAAAHRLDRPNLHSPAPAGTEISVRPVVLVAGPLAAGDQKDVSGIVGAGDPGLLAVDHIVAVVPPRLAGDVATSDPASGSDIAID